jgi:hypothetical protein
MYAVDMISGGTIYESFEEYERYYFNNLKRYCTNTGITDEGNLTHTPLT